jgi:hypothetical protein
VPGADEGAVALQRTEVIAIASHADVAVGAHHEQGEALDAQEIGSRGVEVSDPGGQVGLGPDGDGGFEQG